MVYRQPAGLCTRVVDAGYFASFAAGRRGRPTNSPPQFGHVFFNLVSAHALQNVHSNVQMRASVESFGRSRLQHSQLGRSSSIAGSSSGHGTVLTSRDRRSSVTGTDSRSRPSMQRMLDAAVAEDTLIDGEIISRKAAENHFRESIIQGQKGRHTSDCDFGGQFDRITIDPSADAWECNGRKITVIGQFKAAPITRCKQLRFAVFATSPDRPDRVDDEPCR